MMVVIFNWNSQNLVAVELCTPLYSSYSFFKTLSYYQRKHIKAVSNSINYLQM